MRSDELIDRLMDRLTTTDGPQDAFSTAQALLPMVSRAVSEAYDRGYCEGARDALRSAS
jgi:hypothetical protein